jgi:hypothetical protein
MVDFIKWVVLVDEIEPGLLSFQNRLNIVAICYWNKIKIYNEVYENNRNVFEDRVGFG